MTYRPSERARAKALAVLTREAAEIDLPDLDWDRIESKVLSDFERGKVASSRAERATAKKSTPKSPSWTSTPWPIGLAAAAAAILVFASGGEGSRAPTKIRDERAHFVAPRPPIGGYSPLDVGEVVETGARSALQNRPGPVSFLLAANSKIEVVANDFEEGKKGGIIFALERGSILASVTQHSADEIFAIEVGQTRVAAHGTAFSVTREENRVVVEVSEGVVAVGPVGHRGATHGWLVGAPSRAAFSLDGAREAEWLDTAPKAPPAVETPSEPPIARPESSAARTKRSATTSTTALSRAESASRKKIESAVESASESSAAQETNPAAHEPGWGEGAPLGGRDRTVAEADAASAILRQLELCYAQLAYSTGIRFSIESMLTLTLAPSGAIREGVFSPPLSPTLMSCADKAIGAAHFPRGEAVRHIRIPVRLSHELRAD